MFEALEVRKMLAAAGTAGDDIVRFGGTSTSNAFVIVNGKKTTLSFLPGATAVTFDAGAGNDSITVDSNTGYRVIAFGGAGNDTIVGGPKGDTLFGQAGNDVIRGLGGGDYCVGGAGNDLIDGGASADSLVGDGTNSENGAPYTDPTTEIGNDTLTGGDDADTLNGSGGADLVSGNAGNDIIIFNPVGAIVIDGGAGTNNLLVDTDTQFTLSYDNRANDGLSGQGAKIVNVNRFSLQVGPGSVVDFRKAAASVFIDYVRTKPSAVTSAPIIVYGSAFNDTINALYSLDNTQPLAINAGAGNDTVFGNAGNDRIEGGVGNDSINALGGNDVISGGDDDDTIDAYDGNDTVSGGTGADNITGGAGADRIFGNAGRDTLIGAGGNDRLYGGPDAADLIGGGAGNDLASDDNKDTVENVETILTGVDVA